MGWYLGTLLIALTLGFFDVLSVGTFGLLLLEALFVPGILYAAYHGLWLGKPFRYPTSLEMGAVVAFLACFLLSSLGTVFTGDSTLVIQSFKTFAHLFFLWLFAVLMLMLPITPEDWMKAVKIHFAWAGVVMLFGIYQLPARMYDWPLAWIDITNASFGRGQSDVEEFGQLALRFKSFYRATSIFPEPSALVGFAIATLVMLIVPYFRSGVRLIKTPWMFWSLVTLSVLSTFLAFSLTGLVMLAVVVAGIVVLYRQESIRKLSWTFVAMCVLIVAADRVVEQTASVSVLELFYQRVASVVSGAAIEAETGTIVGESVPQRVADYQVAFEAWQESPVTGVGPGNFAHSLAGRQHNSPFPSTVFGGAIAELGLPGLLTILILFFGTLGAMVMVERRWTRTHLGEDSALEMLIPWVPFRWLLIVLTGFTGHFYVSAVFWLDVTLLFSIQTEARRRLGMVRDRSIVLVRTGWRDRLLMAQEREGKHGTHH